jgi:alpha-tubulin suppressor-like RCC1 family protein
MAVAAGGQHTLVRLADATVLAAGQNAFGQLGLGHTTTPVTVFTAVPALEGVLQVAAGYFHSVALDAGGHVRVWGRNFEGQCGGGSAAPVIFSSPEPLAGLADAPVAMAAGYHFTLVELADGNIVGIGSNADGQLDGLALADQDDSPKVFEPLNVPLLPDLIPPAVASLSPANGATGLSGAFLLVLTFDEPVVPVAGTIRIRERPGKFGDTPRRMGNGLTSRNPAQAAPAFRF